MAKPIRKGPAILSKAAEMLSIVRIARFDTSTPDGRAKERHRRAAWTAIASAAAKGVSVLTALISIPLTYRYLGAERYGIWMTISSVITMLAFADFGIGNGLLNRVAEAHGKGDLSRIQQYVSSAFLMLVGVAFGFAVLLLLGYQSIDWSRLLNLPSASVIYEGRQATLAFALCFIINLPLGIVTRIQLAYQRGFVNSLWSVGGNLLGLGGLLFAIRAEAGLPWLVLAMAGAPVLALVGNAIGLFGHQNRDLIPSLFKARVVTVRSLLGVGSGFFLLQLCYGMAFTSDNIIAAQILGQKSVGDLSVVARLFGIVPMLMEMILAPLWPAYAEALARGDVSWAKKTLSRTAFIGAAFSFLIATALILTGEWIFQSWVSREVQVTFSLLVAFGVWTILSVLGASVAMFLNGSGRLKFQVICGLALAVIAPLVKIAFAQKVGLAGIIWGNVLAYTVCVAIPIAFYLPAILRDVEKPRPLSGP